MLRSPLHPPFIASIELGRHRPNLLSSLRGRIPRCHQHRRPRRSAIHNHLAHFPTQPQFARGSVHAVVASRANDQRGLEGNVASDSTAVFAEEAQDDVVAGYVAYEYGAAVRALALHRSEEGGEVGGDHAHSDGPSLVVGAHVVMPVAMITSR